QLAPERPVESPLQRVLVVVPLEPFALLRELRVEPRSHLTTQRFELRSGPMFDQHPTSLVLEISARTSHPQVPRTGPRRSCLGLRDVPGRRRRASDRRPRATPVAVRKVSQEVARVSSRCQFIGRDTDGAGGAPLARKFITYESLDGGSIVRITLNRTRTRNAQNRGLLVELDDAFSEAEADDAVRVVILGGAGPIFSSGHDLGSTEAVAEWTPGPDFHP